MTEVEIPDDQQEDESDILGDVYFRNSVVLNADWTIETINSQIDKGNIDLQPSFQRRAAWDDVRKSRLIESIIAGMPVPNIVLAENKKSTVGWVPHKRNPSLFPVFSMMGIAALHPSYACLVTW